jgi:1-acyl-sn-glycerol-3-phosphate acyltransferase
MNVAFSRLNHLNSQSMNTNIGKLLIHLLSLVGPSFSSPTTFYGEAKSSHAKTWATIFIFIFSLNVLHCIFMRYNLTDNYSFPIKLID